MENEFEKYREELLKIGLELGEVVQVPYYECGVQAGIPTECGDVPAGMMLIPKDLYDDSVITMMVRGESMIAYDIREGDKLIVHVQHTAQSGDIVIAMINGASTVKTYFEDEDGDKWLIPGNPNFTPIQLKPEDDNMITGVVRQIIHESPRTAYRDCARAIKNVKKEQKRIIRDVDIARALKAAIETMQERKLTGSRPWFAVYRTFTDRGIIENGDYSGFTSLLERIIGEECPIISVKDMKQNMDVMSFAHPVSMWTIDNAPVTGKRFYDYLEVANVTNKALSNKI